MIIGGSASQKLSSKIANELNDYLCPIETIKFPDGERYIRFHDKIEKEVVVVQSTCFPQDANIMELLFMIKTLKELGAEEIKTVIPYFGYGRQEKRFKDGEVISASVVSELLEFAGATEVYSVNLHEPIIKKFFNIPLHEISAASVMKDYISDKIDDPILIGPDKGSLGFIKEISKSLGCEYDHMEKIRLSADKVVTKTKEVDVESRNMVIVDDIISTGGTIVNTVNILKKQGAHSINVACVHPVLVEDAILKIFSSGAKDIIGTDTVISEVNSVSVASVIADTL